LYSGAGNYGYTGVKEIYKSIRVLKCPGMVQVYSDIGVLSCKAVVQVIRVR